MAGALKQGLLNPEDQARNKYSTAAAADAICKIWTSLQYILYNTNTTETGKQVQC